MTKLILYRGTMKSTKSIYWTLAVLLILFTAVFNWADLNQDENKAMENWTKYSTPGQSHQFLAKQEGDWDVAVKTWMQPGAPPSESAWMAHGKMILGGRYLQIPYHGKMMGMPYEVLTTTAFDNHLDSFITSWIDNMGTVTTLTSKDSFTAVMFHSWRAAKK